MKKEILEIVGDLREELPKVGGQAWQAMVTGQRVSSSIWAIFGAIILLISVAITVWLCKDLAKPEFIKEEVVINESLPLQDVQDERRTEIRERHNEGKKLDDSEAIFLSFGFAILAILLGLFIIGMNMTGVIVPEYIIIKGIIY